MRTLMTAMLGLAASAGVAFAQDDAAQPLDDAASIESATTEALEPDDADMDAAGGIAGVQAAGGPIAFATIYSNGQKQSGTGNVSSSFNSSFRRYEITIANENYYYLNYATVITPAGDNRFCKSSSVGGKLLVYCYDPAGNAQPARFGFVTFKP